MTGPILVTGGSGQLAQALLRADPACAVVGRPGFDFDRPATIAATLAAHAPRFVINAAAWTAVDAAEAEPEAAARANAEGPALIARFCREHAIPLIHISTDYVFDGLKGAPYTEQDAPHPTGTYGRTKLAGEHAVLEASPNAVILRTAWVYAEHGRNFVRTMLAASRRASTLRVVADQLGSPTNADDLAACVLAIADRMLHAPHASQAGITHATGTGATSWHGFARAIFEQAALHDWPMPTIQAIATADWPTPAPRPPDSRLDGTRLMAVFGVALPAWRPSLDRAVAAICESWPGESWPDSPVSG